MAHAIRTTTTTAQKGHQKTIFKKYGSEDLPPENLKSSSLSSRTPQVITVGVSRPVNSCNFEISKAISPNDFTTSNWCWPRSPVTGSYFSKYRRIVAPATPVPESRKIIRAVLKDDADTLVLRHTSVDRIRVLKHVIL